MIPDTVVWTSTAFAILLGVLVYVLFGVDPNYLTAAATVALAAFAGVQVVREVLAHRRRRETAERRLQGVAWLARRSCEVTLRNGVGYMSAYHLAMTFTRRRPLDRLEAHFREVLAVSSSLGGDRAACGGCAFEKFLAAADRFNEIMEPGKGGYTQLANEALGFLWSAVDDLKDLAPRRAHEPPLPDFVALGPRQQPPTPPPTPAPAAVAPPDPSGRASLADDTDPSL